MDSPRCHRTILAESPQARVEACSCGLVHVSVGALTLRMDPEACEGFTTVLARAMVEARRRHRAIEAAEARPQLRVVGDGVDA